MDIRSKSLKPVIKELAKKYDLDEENVINIIQHQFAFVKKKMKRADSYNDFFPQIRLVYLGMFKVKEGKRKHLIKKSRKIVEDVQIESGK